MESGLTRDGRATTVSHTRFGRARRPRFISTLYMYLGARRSPFYGCIFARAAGCGVAPVCGVPVYAPPRARGVTVQVAKDPTRKCHRRVKALFARRPPWPVRVPAHAPRYTPAVRPRGDRASALLWYRPPRREEDVPQCPLADFRVSLSPCAMRRCGPGRRCAPAEG